MDKYVLAYDLGTGGIKACLYSTQGKQLCFSWQEYETYYANGMQEQKPEDWWQAVCASTKALLKDAAVLPEQIAAVGVSGHSLGVTALDKKGNLVFEKVPIWSDSRANKQADKFFEKISCEDWYKKTGCGFPPGQYPLFKIMWYEDNYPEKFENCHVFIGTKDYINYKLTGKIATDNSYASGSGIYSQAERCYIKQYIDAAGINEKLLPNILEPDSILGNIHEDAARLLGLEIGTIVVCGAVDNACMALGAGCYKNGNAYMSLGTSAWIALSDKQPVLDFENKTYVFENGVKGQYVSAACTFTAGRALRWARDVLFADIAAEALQNGKDPYDAIIKFAASSPAGANGVMFNPSLSGGAQGGKAAYLKASFTGITLGTTRQDIARAVLEGIALDLRCAFEILQKSAKINEPLLIVGGGAKNNIWMQIFADVFAHSITTTDVDQNAGALGAAALALKGAGIWQGYSVIAQMHNNKKTYSPQSDNAKQYNLVFSVFKSLIKPHINAAVELEKGK